MSVIQLRMGIFVLILLAGFVAGGADEANDVTTEQSGAGTVQVDVSELEVKAKAGDAEAQFRLGCCYLLGDGVINDSQEALKWIRMSAEQSYADAQLFLGTYYLNNGKDFQEAVVWFRKAAEQGDATAQCTLAFCYEGGVGVSKNAQEAFKWYHRAAVQGNIIAQFYLARFYQFGWGVQKDDRQAFRWFSKAAKQGNREAELCLGFCYLYGNGIVRNHQEAVKWFRKAAMKGDMVAQYILAVCYKDGVGVPEDYREASDWYRRSAEQGNADAQFGLGLCYANGNGVTQNTQKAAYWYHKAAEQSHGGAQLLLSLCYAQGEGVFEDYVKAYKWALLAGKNGEDIAKLKTLLISQMTLSQIAEAQRLAKEFVAQREGGQDESYQRGDVEKSEAVVSTGTGFFVSDNGYLVTAYHVIEDVERIEIRTLSGTYSANVVMGDAMNDIAVLRVDAGRALPSLSMVSSAGVKTGDEVFTIGFPNVVLQGMEPKYTEGTISSLTGSGNDPRHFQISTPVQPGNSGGPLVDSRGNVVGIVVAKLSSEVTLRQSGSLPENVNYAVKGSLVLSLLEVIPDAVDLSGNTKPKENGKDRSAIIEDAKAAVGMVVCY